MFVLMSKRTAAATAPEPPNVSAAHVSRTQNACDACRIRKTKCDGQTPCGRCRAKQLICTSSRRLAKALGPVTGEHVAILKEQQRRLTRAIANMSGVIKSAESLGGWDDGNKPAEPELSPSELAEVLERFAPESPVAEDATLPVDEDPLPSKRRRLQSYSTLGMPGEDVRTDEFPLPQANNEGHDPFQKFLATVQQHSSHSSSNVNTASGTLSPTFASFDPQQTSQALPMANPPATPSAAPLGSSALDFHPQLTPLMDLVDWDASLEHFLDSQYNTTTDGRDWSIINGDVDWSIVNGTGPPHGS